jgi:toxin ParE1/3/4
VAIAINWTREAELWLRDIYEYISQDNPVAAADVVTGIYQRAQVLITHPDIGHRYEGTSDRDIRILLYGHYRIAYLAKRDGNIDILGVFHGAMQISSYLFDGGKR